MNKRAICIMALSLWAGPSLLWAGEFESQFKALLTAHNSQGAIRGIELSGMDYLALRRDERLGKAAQALAEYDLRTLTTEAERLSFWINAYNFLAVKLMADHWPVKSIKDLGSVFAPVWKKKVGRVGGAERTLDEIETDILRKEFNEPRIHAAIVCASVSCPDLRAEVFDAAQLDAQLSDQVRVFLSNPKKGFSGADGVVVSPIFKWFAEDFEKKHGSVIAFIKLYQPTLKAESKLNYFDYDWGVNYLAKPKNDQ